MNYGKRGRRKGEWYAKVAMATIAAFSVHATATPAPIASATPASVASVPLFAELSAEGTNLRSYSVPVQLVVSIHKFIFTFHLRRSGAVDFEWPDTLTVSVARIPKRYTSVFGQLGTLRTWPQVYDLELLGSDLSSGSPTYHVRGVPLQPSDVDHVLIDTTEANAPIHATWVLHSGWTLTSTIQTKMLESYRVPAREITDIVGHGLRIHADMTYGTYTLGHALNT